MGNNLKHKLKYFISLLCLTFLVSLPLAAQDTGATAVNTGIYSTNTVITYTNFTGISYTNTGEETNLIVQAIYGFTNFVSIQYGTTNTVAAGQTFYYKYVFTNFGNSNSVFSTAVESNMGAVTGNDWSLEITSPADSNTVISGGDIAQDNEYAFVAKITIDPLAVDGDLGIFYLTNTIAETRDALYSATNGYTYGGYDLFSDVLTFVVGGPVVTATKAVSIANNAGGTIGAGEVIPGAEVTYTITFTNTGSTNAYNVVFTEDFDETIVNYLVGASSASVAATFETDEGGWSAEPAANQGFVNDTTTGVRWTIADIPANTGGTLEYTVVVR